MAADRRGRRLELALVLFGASCLGWYGYSTLQAVQFQREQSAAFTALLESAPVADVALAPAPSVVTPAPAAPAESATAAAARAPLTTPPVRTPRVELPDPRMIGLLEVPRLRLSTAVMSGDDASTLNLSAGHLPDTPKPWERGNSAVAAHRDQHFRPLKNIRIGDEVRMRTMRGDLRYRVKDIKIVAPDDLSVLEPQPEDVLTLITCYPFNYVGAAPKRYIVHAERVQAPAAAESSQDNRR